MMVPSSAMTAQAYHKNRAPPCRKTFVRMGKPRGCCPARGQGTASHCQEPGGFPHSPKGSAVAGVGLPPKIACVDLRRRKRIAEGVGG
jgi:hypothetical protein